MWTWAKPWRLARLHFKRSYVNAPVADAPKTGSALIVDRWRSKSRIARIDSRAAGQ